MPLKLASITAAPSTNILNTWADGQERTLNTQSTQIQTLQQGLSSLQTTVANLPAPVTQSQNTSTSSPSATGTFGVPSASVGGGATNAFNTGIVCDLGDVISWCYQGTPPAVGFVTKVLTLSVSGTVQIVVHTDNFGTGTSGFGSYVINYRIN